MRSTRLRAIFLLSLCCSTPGASGARSPALFATASTYLQPNAEDVDGAPAYVHLVEADMPLRVAVSRPPDSPKYGSREDGRNAVISGIRLWEQALQPEIPWFRVDFVEKDPAAAVQVKWKRRIIGDAAGRGGLAHAIEDGRLRVEGAMWIAVQSDPFTPALTVEQLELLVAHEFGHVLGLGHCLDCDSAMNYEWETRKRTLVTPLDIETVRALFAIPNGQRLDGGWMQGVTPPAAPLPTAADAVPATRSGSGSTNEERADPASDNRSDSPAPDAADR